MQLRAGEGVWLRVPFKASFSKLLANFINKSLYCGNNYLQIANLKVVLEYEFRITNVKASKNRQTLTIESSTLNNAGKDTSYLIGVTI